VAVVGEKVQKGRPDVVNACHIDPVDPIGGLRKGVPPLSRATLLDKPVHPVQKLCNGIRGLPWLFAKESNKTSNKASTRHLTAVDSRG
jgi:hypothetical protein